MSGSKGEQSKWIFLLDTEKAQSKFDLFDAINGDTQYKMKRKIIIDFRVHKRRGEGTPLCEIQYGA